MAWVPFYRQGNRDAERLVAEDHRAGSGAGRPAVLRSHKAVLPVPGTM